MRRRAIVFLLAGTVAGTVALVPSAASANGGALIELDRTHYLPGETAVATAYVWVPERRQDLLERGPFHAFVVPYGVDLREGRPIPDEAIRVGTFEVLDGKRDAFELRASYLVPDLPGDYYRVALCNVPCTVSGFAEPLSGDISIVATQREAELLTATSRLGNRLFGLRRQLRKAGKELEYVRTQLDLVAAERSDLQSRVEELEATLEARPATAAARPAPVRPIVDAWGAAALAAALALLVAVLALVRRRSDRFHVPDTIEELERDVEHPAPR